VSFTSKYAYWLDLRAALLMEGCGKKLCHVKLQFLKLLARQMCRKDIEGICPEAIIALSFDHRVVIDKCFPKLLLRERHGLNFPNKCEDDITMNDETVEKIVEEFLERFKTEISFEKL
jgi:hypothetical protein